MLPLQPAPVPGFTSGDTLDQLLQFMGEGAADADFCGWWHPGDIRHLLSNGARGEASNETLFVVKDENDQMIAVIVTHLYKPNLCMFDIMLDPTHDEPQFRKELALWAEQQLAAKAQTADLSTYLLVSDFMECEPNRQQVMDDLGYDLAPAYMHFAARPLDDIPDSVLPDGFLMRNAQGIEEAGALAAVHVGAFGSSWTAESYQKVMETPGFEIDHELVVVAPEGRFAAFLIYWVDPISKTGLFEPVGCHADFQRRGLTKALMYEGMRRMRAEGAHTAMVKYMVDNPAAMTIYASVGFTIKHAIQEFQKKVES